MKKIFGITFFALLLASCQIDDGQSPGRNQSRLKSECNYLLRTTFDGPTEAFRQAMRIQDFISADEDGRKDPKFLDISYSTASDSYVIGQYGDITMNGKTLTETGAIWTVKTRLNGTVEILCCGEGLWNVRGVVSQQYQQTDYSIIFECQPEDYSLGTEFSLKYHGSLIEDSDYYINFESREPMSCKWIASSELGTVSYRPSRKGVVEFRFIKAGRTLDSCYATYNGTGEAGLSVSLIK